LSDQVELSKFESKLLTMFDNTLTFSWAGVCPFLFPEVFTDADSVNEREQVMIKIDQIQMVGLFKKKKKVYRYIRYVPYLIEILR